jgi:hypothetical protein
LWTSAGGKDFTPKRLNWRVIADPLTDQEGRHSLSTRSSLIRGKNRLHSRTKELSRPWWFYLSNRMSRLRGAIPNGLEEHSGRGPACSQDPEPFPKGGTMVVGRLLLSIRPVADVRAAGSMGRGARNRRPRESQYVCQLSNTGKAPGKTPPPPACALPTHSMTFGAGTIMRDKLGLRCWSGAALGIFIGVRSVKEEGNCCKSTRCR